MNKEALMEELVHRNEDVSIYARYQSCVQNMLAAKQEGIHFVPKAWIEILNTPDASCEYTAEQWALIQELKPQLEMLARELGYTQENANAFVTLPETGVAY